jgi:hypothetical protein
MIPSEKDMNVATITIVIYLSRYVGKNPGHVCCPVCKINKIYLERVTMHYLLKSQLFISILELSTAPPLEGRDRYLQGDSSLSCHVSTGSRLGVGEIYLEIELQYISSLGVWISLVQ